MRILGRLTLLVALWLLAWGQVSVANVTSGIAVSAALLVAFPPPRRHGGRLCVSGVGIGRLTAYVVHQLVSSNVVMIREILRRRLRSRPGVVAHRLRQPSEEVVTLMSSVIALSPGTMTVDVDRTSETIYVHFLLLHDVEAARASLDRLERLVVGAIAHRSPPHVVRTPEDAA